MRERAGGWSANDPAALLAGDPAPPRHGDAPVEGRSDLVGDERPPAGDEHAPRFVLHPRLPGVEELDLDTRGAEPLDPAGGFWIRVSRTDDDTRDPFRDDPVGARRGRALVGARLERHEHRRAAGTRPRRVEGDRLRVAAPALGDAFRDHVTVAHDHRSDGRLRIGAGGRIAGEAERAREAHAGACASARSAQSSILFAPARSHAVDI